MTFISTRELAGGAVALDIDRPPANALDLELLQELGDALEAAAAQPAGGARDRRPAGLLLGRASISRRLPTYGPRAAARGGPRDQPHGHRRLRHALPGGGGGDRVTRSPAGWCWRCAPTTGSAPRRAGTADRGQVGVPYPQAAIAVVRAELAPPAARTAGPDRTADRRRGVRCGSACSTRSRPRDRVLDRALEVGRRAGGAPGRHLRAHQARPARRGDRRHARAAAADPLLDL